MKLKRFKTSAWLGALSLVVALALGSCTKEPLGFSTPSGDGIEVRVTFAQSAASKATTRAPEDGTPEENRLDRVTILVFSADGTKLETVLSENVSAGNATELSITQPKWANDQTLLVKPVIKQSEPKKIYAIANWDKKEFDKAAYTEAMLKAELTTITAVADMNGTTAYPMLMSGSKSVENLTTKPVTVDMARQAAKIKAVVTLKKAVQNKLPNIEWQSEEMKITVANIPDKSYIIGSGASPADITWLEETNVTQADPASKEDLTWSDSLYITENPIIGTEKKNATYILVQLPYKNGTNPIVYDNYYKLLVNDPLDGTSPHKVLRNTIYNFKINIIGIGLPLEGLGPNVNVEDRLTVNDWENGENFDVEAKPIAYFNIDHTSIVLQMDGKPLTITITTNMAGMKLIDAAGKTLLSFYDDKDSTVTVEGIKYTVGGYSNSVTITVIKDESLRPSLKQNMFFISRNLKVPFTVTLDAGFIPNSVLQKHGWPTDRLPLEGGLQLAKRGNKVLPSGVAEKDDPVGLKWNTDGSTTIAVESVTDFGSAEFGMGKGSTDAMTKTAAEALLHPAAKYCRDMGPEWYLPSIAELNLICDNQALLGDSYKLAYDDNYWSATQVSTSNVSNAWYAVYTDSTGSYSKTNTNTKIRCVKGTIPPPARSFVPTANLVGSPRIITGASRSSKPTPAGS